MNPLISILNKFKKDRTPGRLRNTFNLQPDKEDKRDKIFRFKPIMRTAPDEYYFLKDCLPPIKNQGNWGSCGSHAIVSAIETLHILKKINWYLELSERQHYYDVRLRMKTFPADSGQTLRDGLKTAIFGISPESLCPYNTDKMNMEPNLFARAFQRFWKVKGYSRVYSIAGMKAALAEDRPVIFGALVFPSFCRNRTGLIAMPQNEKSLGGHAMLAWGYDKDSIHILNSWGTRWGDSGCAAISEEYFRKYGMDMWTVDI